MNKLPLRLALLVSGSGTTAEQIILACQEECPLYGLVEPVCLISSRQHAGAIDRAQKAGMDEKHIYICQPKDYLDKDEFGQNLQHIFEEEEVEIFGQYGWMPKTPGSIVTKYYGINQHPGPLPEFGGQGMYGLRVHAAIVNFSRMILHRICTFAVAQEVTIEYDAGKIIFAQPVPVDENDTAETLQKRVLPVEHQVQILALGRLAAEAETQGGLHFATTTTVELYISPREKQYIKKAKRLAIEQYP